MDVREKIRGIIREIMEQNDLEDATIEESSLLVKDLGFTSLDVAELIANLEMELDVDPFSNGVSLMEVRTYGDICTVYEKFLQQAGK